MSGRYVTVTATNRSQIFILDRVGSSSHRNDLDNITRDHDSINCNSSLPWVSILVNLGLKESAVELKFPGKKSHGAESGNPCLRIYAAAINSQTFPFLSESKQLLSTLQNIIAHEDFLGLQLTQILQKQVQYGDSCTNVMEWEASVKVLHNSEGKEEKGKTSDGLQTRGKKRKAS
ncbi:hypothetical protein BKA82DRAFT_4359784 [Pisolithus tinctorius]|nr:hypothetical protein BKA82DRAFT_4359784 [Pisolithus tinctorius]